MAEIPLKVRVEDVVAGAKKAGANKFTYQCLADLAAKVAAVGAPDPIGDYAHDVFLAGDTFDNFSQAEWHEDMGNFVSGYSLNGIAQDLRNAYNIVATAYKRLGGAPVDMTDYQIAEFKDLALRFSDSRNKSAVAVVIAADAIAAQLEMEFKVGGFIPKPVTHKPSDKAILARKKYALYCKRIALNRNVRLIHVDNTAALTKIFEAAPEVKAFSGTRIRLIENVEDLEKTAETIKYEMKSGTLNPPGEPKSYKLHFLSPRIKGIKIDKDFEQTFMGSMLPTNPFVKVSSLVASTITKPGSRALGAYGSGGETIDTVTRDYEWHMYHGTVRISSASDTIVVTAHTLPGTGGFLGRATIDLAKEFPEANALGDISLSNTTPYRTVSLKLGGGSGKTDDQVSGTISMCCYIEFERAVPVEPKVEFNWEKLTEKLADIKDEVFTFETLGELIQIGIEEGLDKLLDVIA